MDSALGLTMIEGRGVKMKQTLLTVFLTSLGLSTSFNCSVIPSKSLMDKPAIKLEAQHADKCDAQLDINLAIDKLSAGDRAQADQTKKLLLHYSKRSLYCRNEIAAALIQAMTRPDLNFVSDQSSYFLWVHGSTLLGDLKATEALDPLIDHLDLNDGLFSASMVHQPVVLGVKAMGVLAVPKLHRALEHNPNRNIRLAAAFCMVEIGGSDAVNALKQSLGTESDPCVSRFFRIASEISDSESKSKTRPHQSETDKRIGLRRQLLMAFKCDT